MSRTQRDTILVVDDTPDTLGFLTDALEQANITVLVATDGASAIKTAGACDAGFDSDGCNDAGDGRVRDLPSDQGRSGASRICR
jgi:hypothetical protein